MNELGDTRGNTTTRWLLVWHGGWARLELEAEA